nr:hypothetical protein [uncultured Pseudomonas sp.]
MPEQKDDQPITQDHLGLGPEFIEAFGGRPLTAREIVQWLSRCLEHASDLQQLQLHADFATGAMRALVLCWLVSPTESETIVAELNAVYGVRYRHLSGAIVH